MRQIQLLNGKASNGTRAHKYAKFSLFRQIFQKVHCASSLVCPKEALDTTSDSVGDTQAWANIKTKNKKQNDHLLKAKHFCPSSVSTASAVWPGMISLEQRGQDHQDLYFLLKLKVCVLHAY